MKDIRTAPFVRDMSATCANMYRLGWDERNAGNISLLLDEAEAAEYLDTSVVLRRIPIGFDAKALSGKIFLVTGTGKYFKNVTDKPADCLGLLRISAEGTEAELLWGYEDGGSFTSELPAHLMSHMVCLEKDPANRVVLHSHPIHTIAMSKIHPLDERSFTRSLWKNLSEGIMVFPEGIGILPWMVFGTTAIGEATAKKMKEHRLVLWPLHGIYGSGRSLDDAFGLIETVEKAAQIYILTAPMPAMNRIKDHELRALAEHLKLNYREDYLD